MTHIRVPSYLAVCSTLLLSAVATAQSSSACLPIGTGSAVGCQSSTGPELTNGVVATGDVEFTYDSSTGALTVVVANTSPVVLGETTPVITRVAFNVPAGAVTAATLVSQTGSGGPAPAFALDFSDPPSNGLGCLGFFSAELWIQNVIGGIGNPAATVQPHPQTVLGPVTFELQLSGPGVAALTAGVIASTASQGGSPSVPVGVKFQGGGIGGEESGFVSNGGVCCLNAAAVQSVGAGCAPAGLTIPTLSSIGAPVVGGPVGVDVQSPSTPSAVGLLVFGLSSTFDPIFNQPLPIDLTPYGFPGCSLYASNEFPVALALDANGDGTYSTNIPPLAKWCERELTFQAFFLSSSGGLLSSAGLTAILGS